MGGSGCGKTTLLRHLAGFLVPDAGAIWFGDQDVTQLPPHRRHQAQVVQQAGVQALGDLPHRVDGLPGEIDDPVGDLPVLVPLQPAAYASSIELDGGQDAAEDIVQFPRNQVALLLPVLVDAGGQRPQLFARMAEILFEAHIVGNTDGHAGHRRTAPEDHPAAMHLHVHRVAVPVPALGAEAHAGYLARDPLADALQVVLAAPGGCQVADVHADDLLRRVPRQVGEDGIGVPDHLVLDDIDADQRLLDDGLERHVVGRRRGGFEGRHVGFHGRRAATMLAQSPVALRADAGPRGRVRPTRSRPSAAPSARRRPGPGPCSRASRERVPAGSPATAGVRPGCRKAC